MKRKSVILIALVLVVLVVTVVGVYWVGNAAVNETSEISKSAEDPCSYTQQERKDVLKLYENDYVVDPGGIREEPTAANKEEIEKLVGECELVALRKAYNLGARSLRDLTDCENCPITLDYRYDRINIVVKDKRISSIAVY